MPSELRSGDLVTYRNIYSWNWCHAVKAETINWEQVAEWKLANA